jgi:hypothetical protein
MGQVNEKPGQDNRSLDNTTKGGALVEPGSAGDGSLPRPQQSSTPAHYTPVRKETIEKRLSRRLDLIDETLTDQQFVDRLNIASLKDVAVVEGIYLDKLTELRGQPNRVVGSDTRAKLTEFMAAAVQELSKRGMTVKLTERTAEVTRGPEGPEPVKVIESQ